MTTRSRIVAVITIVLVGLVSVSIALSVRRLDPTQRTLKRGWVIVSPIMVRDAIDPKAVLVPPHDPPAPDDVGTWAHPIQRWLAIEAAMPNPIRSELEQVQDLALMSAAFRDALWLGAIHRAEGYAISDAALVAAVAQHLRAQWYPSAEPCDKAAVPVWADYWAGTASPEAVTRSTMLGRLVANEALAVKQASGGGRAPSYEERQGYIYPSSYCLPITPFTDPSTREGLIYWNYTTTLELQQWFSLSETQLGLTWGTVTPFGGQALAPPALPPMQRDMIDWEAELQILDAYALAPDPQRVTTFFAQARSPVEATVAHWHRAFLDLPPAGSLVANADRAVAWYVGMHHTLISVYAEQYQTKLYRPLEAFAVRHPRWKSVIPVAFGSASPSYPDEVAALSGVAMQVLATEDLVRPVHTQLLEDGHTVMLSVAGSWPFAFDAGYAWGQDLARQVAAHHRRLYAMPSPSVSP